MQDRVADVLAQRAALDRSGLSGVAVSVLLHGSLIGLAVYAALHRPPPTPASTLKIRFAQAPRTATATAAPAVPKPKPVAPRIEPPRPEPVKKPEPTKPVEKNTVPMSPFGKSTKKGSENAPMPKPAEPPAPSSALAASEPGVGEAGVTGLEGGDFPYTLYIERMKNTIASKWARPQVGGGAKTVVYFQIARDGTISNAETRTVSGSRLFDRSAVSAVLSSSPRPPLPMGYSGTYLGVHLTFR